MATRQALPSSADHDGNDDDSQENTCSYERVFALSGRPPCVVSPELVGEGDQGGDDDAVQGDHHVGPERHLERRRWQLGKHPVEPQNESCDPQRLEWV